MGPSRFPVSGARLAALMKVPSSDPLLPQHEIYCDITSYQRLYWTPDHVVDMYHHSPEANMTWH
jgi:hypothetical protein